MHRQLKLAISVLSLSLAASCHSIKVESTFDRQVDFSRMHTFAWVAAPVKSPSAIGQTDFYPLIAAELAAHGLSRVDKAPDLLVAVHRMTQGKLSTEGWGYEFREGRIQYYTLQEGHLVIDLVDPYTKVVVWRGSAEGVFKADMSAEERRALATDVLKRMFADFPKKG
jgi:Domain of unknown function (DUF4136)